MKKTKNNKSGLGRSALNLRKSKNAFLTLALLLMLATGLQASLSDGLVAYYPFNGNANDESGNGNHGSPVGGATWTTGVLDGAVHLNGSAYINVPDSPSLDLPGGRGTISAFIKIDPSSDEFGIVSKESSSSFPWTIAYEFNVRYSGTLETFLISDGATTNLGEDASVASLKDSTWHHVAATWSGPGGEIRMYRDGVQIIQSNQTISTINDISEPVRIGAFRWNVGGIYRYMTGDIDEVRIYERALSQTEVMELAGVGPSEPIAYWSFDNPSDPGHDDSGNGHDGAVYGAEPIDGICGNAMKFDGIDDYVDMGLPSELRITGALTVGAWFLAEPEALSEHPKIVSRCSRDVYSGYSWETRLYWGRPECWVSENGYHHILAFGQEDVSSNKWHHLAMAYQPDDFIKLYLDGVLVGQVLGDSVPDYINDPDDVPIYVGAFYWEGVTPGSPFTGNIDEVRIYDRALSQTEVMELAAIPESPSGGKLLVRSHNGSDWDLHLIGEDGSHLQAIDTTSAKIDFRGADFSPDGKNIIYVRSNGATYEIMQVPVTGGPPSLVLGNTGLPYALAARWGSPPDHFFYTIQTGGSCGNRDWVTRRRALDGSFDEIIISAVSEKDLYLFDIREDLNRSVYGQNIPAGCWSPYGALVTYDADGSNRHVLPPTNDGKCDSYATLSQDGEYILYAKSDSASGWQNPANIYIIRYDGSDQTRLTNYSGNTAARAPVWRDNDSFFYSVSPTDNPEDEILHYYIISTGEDVVVPCDLPNCQPLDFMITPEAPTIPATIEIIPNTLNLKSKGRWITCYIRLPEDYDVSDISLILLEDKIEPRQIWSDEKKQVMKTRFSREEVQDILTVGQVELLVTGQLTDGTLFEATDVIRVIDKGGKEN